MKYKNRLIEDKILELFQYYPIVAVLGASAKPDRYSYKACQLLMEKGHEVWPIHPALQTVQGMDVFPSLEKLPDTPDVVTVYVGKQNLEALTEALMTCGAKKVIFNPGTEAPRVMAACKAAGMDVLEACTLVLLHTGQF